MSQRITEEKLKFFAKGIKRYIKIDGDTFIEAIPTFEMYRDIFHSSREMTERLLHKAAVMSRNEDGSLVIAGISQTTQGDCFILDWNKDGEIRGDGLGYWSYHPVLVPVKDGHLFDPYLRRHYYNGKIITGGSFYYNVEGSSWTAIDASRSTITKDFNTEKYRFGDTDRTCEMQWVVWNGCLFSINAIALVEYSDIDQLNPLIINSHFSAYMQEFDKYQGGWI